MDNFGETAKGLSQNPLGIIALFITLVYGLAVLVVGFGKGLDEASRVPLIWFMVIFPVLILGVFAWLVSQHHEKLYAPRDFEKGDFLRLETLKRLAAQSSPELLTQMLQNFDPRLHDIEETASVEDEDTAVTEEGVDESSDDPVQERSELARVLASRVSEQEEQ